MKMLISLNCTSAKNEINISNAYSLSVVKHVSFIVVIYTLFICPHCDAKWNIDLIGFVNPCHINVCQKIPEISGVIKIAMS